MKVTINFNTYENVKYVSFPDGYPDTRYIWLVYEYKTTNFKRSDYLKIDYQAFPVNNKTYIKIEK